jgi:hypothetical protein
LESASLQASLKWFSFLPAALIRRSLKAGLEQETEVFFQRCRDQALALIAESVKRMTGQIADQLNAAAHELQSRLAAAITGERRPEMLWRQSSTPVRGAGWGNPALDSIRDKLSALRARSTDFAESQSPALEPGAALPNEKREIPKVREIDLAQDLKTRGCAVCDHLVRIAFDFLAHWQFAISAEETAQNEFAREEGFCPLHMWQLHAVSSTVGESIGLARLIEHTASSLKSSTAARDRPAADCRVCRLIRQSETAYIERLAAFLREAAGQEAYGRSQGVCLRHLTVLLPHVSDEIAQFLRQEAARHFDETAEEMQSYAIKRDALRRTLQNRDENDAHLRALIHFAGAKDVSTPWPEDREI